MVLDGYKLVHPVGILKVQAVDGAWVTNERVIIRMYKYQISPLFRPGLLSGEFLEKFSHNSSPWAKYWGDGLVIGNVNYVRCYKCLILSI